MKEALFYEKKDNYVQCHLCPKNCIIKEDKYGNCGVRKNINGKLISEVYGKAVSVAIDPIEKKPLYHFYPGSKILSFGTVGCNLHCKFCQNYNTSQAKPGEYPSTKISPKQLIELTLKKNCHSIAATYNEPTIFYEYMFDTFKLAKKNKIKTVAVSNGYINKEPLKKLLPYLNAINVDLKAFTNEFYTKISNASLDPILETLKTIHKSKTWLEITNLIIPSLNDDLNQIKEMCNWIKDNLSVNIPLHFSAFYPMYKLDNIEPTPKEILIKARDIAKETGIKYVFIGNIFTEDGESTFCPNCSKIVISRKGYQIIENNVINNHCKYCKNKIQGVF